MPNEEYIKPCPLCNSTLANYERTLNQYELIKCKQCQFVYVNLSDEQILKENSHFDEQSSSLYEAQQTIIDAKWFEYIVTRLTRSHKTGGKVLDIGCGNGVLLSYFIKKGWDAYGVDISPWAEDVAKKYNFTLYKSDIKSAGLEDNTFDVVTNTSTLEHIAQPVEFVREIYRILKPGGIAYFGGVPNYGSIAIKINLADFQGNCNIPPFHVNYFTFDSVLELLKQSELVPPAKNYIVKTYGIPELHRLYSALQKVVLRKKSPQEDPTFVPESKPKNSKLKEMIAQVIMLINYYAGKFFKSGDKLEIILTKNDSSSN